MASRGALQPLRRQGRPPAGGLLLAGTVQVDRESIYYQTAGSGEEGRHTVVFVHGMAASSGSWRSQLEAAGGMAYAVSVDLPGHGRSEGNGFERAEDYAVFLRRFLDALGVRQQVVLAGTCLGAAVSLAFAALYPHRVAGLVLAGIGDRFAIDETTLEIARIGVWPEAFWERHTGQRLSGETLRCSHGTWLRTRPEVRYRDLAACAAFRAEEFLEEVRAPALVLAGEQDRITPPEGARGLCRRLPASVLEVVPGAGHLLVLEEPDRYSRALQGFLAAVRPPQPVPSRLL